MRIADCGARAGFMVEWRVEDGFTIGLPPTNFDESGGWRSVEH